jgi:hypothetical protein
MTTEKVNAALSEHKPLSKIGGTLYCTFFNRNYDCVASIWTFDDDDFAALVIDRHLDEHSWYSTPRDAVCAYLNIRNPDDD